MPVKVKLRDYLFHKRLKPFDLVKAAKKEASQGSIYALANKETKMVSLETLSTVIKVLRELTGEEVTPNDLLEYFENETNP